MYGVEIKFVNKIFSREQVDLVFLLRGDYIDEKAELGKNFRIASSK